MISGFLVVPLPSENPLSQRERARVRVFLLSCLLLCLCLNVSTAQAGHGFASSFGNIEWLPEPGESPDSVWYQADAWQEEGQLWLAETPAEKVALYLSFCSRKAG